METKIQSFTEYADASNYLEKCLYDKPKDWSIVEARIVYLNNRWRVGFSAAPSQLEMTI
jgi:hypothetical protein